MNEMRKLMEAVGQALSESTGKIGREMMGKSTIYRKMVPKVYVGTRNTVIELPGARRDGELWEDVNSYDWKKQQANFSQLQAILQRHNAPLTKVSGNTRIGDLTTGNRLDYPNRQPVLQEFVAVSPGVLVWQKYEGAYAGGGQNYVYVGGRKIRLKEFLRLAPEKQDALIQQSSQIQ